jgi:DNA-binding NarL/FixJ family response regulator
VNARGDGNEPDTTDIDALNEAMRCLDKALEAIQYVANGELDKTIPHARWVGKYQEAAQDRMRGMEVGLVRIRNLIDFVNTGGLRRIEGRDGKQYPAHGRNATYRAEDVMTLRDAGLSMRAIATRLRCSVGTVHRIISLAENEEA